MNTPLDRIAVARIGGEALMLGDVLRRCRAEALGRLIRDAIRERIIERGIVEREICVHPEEVARARALLEAEQGEIGAWLRERGMGRAELDQELGRVIAFGKLKEAVVGERAEGSARVHCRIFEEWLELERLRLGVELTYQELL